MKFWTNPHFLRRFVQGTRHRIPPRTVLPQYFSTSSSHVSSSESPDLRRAVTVKGDRAVFSEIMQIMTSAVRKLWIAEGVKSVDDLSCLYTSAGLLPYGFVQIGKRKHRLSCAWLDYGQEVGVQLEEVQTHVAESVRCFRPAPLRTIESSRVAASGKFVRMVFHGSPIHQSRHRRQL